MNIKCIFSTARSVVLELVGTDIYETDQYEIYVNDLFYGHDTRMVFSIYDLQPGTEYLVSLRRGTEAAEVLVETKSEYVTLNVRDFGAVGDGEHDDTQAIQAAIMCCPAKSRVFIPKGRYHITSLFLKSHLTLEIAKGAILEADTKRTNRAVLPGETQSYDGESYYHLGTWEGNPLDTFASVITGVMVEDVVICGEGIVDGCASFDNWWAATKEKIGAWRPRMLFLNHCKNVVVQGITVQNSPSWNIHPYFSDDLRFLDMKILGPAHSPNTDGLDPESCENVEITGVYFSVGDDCIAVKSGKIYMGRKYKKPTKNVRITQCCMRDGHGAVTLGSEIGAGVEDLLVKQCRFLHTDRGLRVKTRRGRGQDSHVDRITFEQIDMDHVKSPFVVNSFYFCDPDGKTEYVYTKEALCVDERTPRIDSLSFSQITCENCESCGAYIYGLPEQKIGELKMEDVTIRYTDDAKESVAAMMIGCEPSKKLGIFVRNVKKASFRNVQVEGQIGEKLDLDGVDQIFNE